MASTMSRRGPRRQEFAGNNRLWTRDRLRPLDRPLSSEKYQTVMLGAEGNWDESSAKILLRPKSNRGVDSRRTRRGQPAGCDANHREHDRNSRQRRRIMWRHTEQESTKQSGGEERA